ncbi:MAG: hypothetical protein IPP40_04195 [bacterium]|nr:hypothetical protein [bacterium]
MKRLRRIARRAEEADRRPRKVTTMLYKFFAVLITLAITLKVDAAVHIVVSGESIQASVNTAADGDTIVLDDGLHSETVVLNNRSIILGSRFILDQDTTHIGSTNLSSGLIGTDTLSCVVVVSGGSSYTRIVGITLSDGLGTRSNRLNARVGGAIYLSGSDLLIEHSRIRDCSASLGGGICLDGESSLGDSATIWMSNVIVEGCVSANAGGGINCQDGTVFIDSCVFINNLSGEFGGAAYISRCRAQIQACNFSQNDAEYTGGLRWINNVGSIELCSFEDNGFQAQSVSSHLHCSGNRTEISGCRFGSSQSGVIGVFLYSDDFDSLATFRGNIVEGLTTLDITGSLGLFSGPGDISYNIFRNNVNINGGAIYVADGVFARIHHNVFENNRSTMPTGGSVLQIAGVNTVRIDSNLIVGNQGPTMTCSIFPNGCVNTIHADNNWWGHESGPFDPLHNPAGQGDTVSNEDVDFTPWLTSPPDTSMPNDVSRAQPVTPSTWRLSPIVHYSSENERIVSLSR